MLLEYPNVGARQTPRREKFPTTFTADIFHLDHPTSVNPVSQLFTAGYYQLLFTLPNVTTTTLVINGVCLLHAWINLHKLVNDTDVMR